MRRFLQMPVIVPLALLLAMAVASCGRERVPSRPFEFVIGTDYHEALDTPIPEKAQEIQDPDFLLTLQRITDKDDGYQGPGIQNEYSKMDPENCDGTLLVLRGNAGNYYIYNPSTCGMIRRITAFDECDFAEPEPRWDAENPGVFYYICDTELRSYDTHTGSSSGVHDFKDEFPGAALVTTKVEGDASLDRRYWCFMVQDADYDLLSVICYDKDADRVVGRKADGFPDAINWVGMSMTGGHCLVGYEDVATYTDVFSRDFADKVSLPDGSAGHGDAALTAEGRDVYVYQNVRTDHIAFADMETGAETPLLQIPFDVNADIGMHVSGNCARTPGWALVSTYGSLDAPPGEQHSWMDEQLFMLELAEGPRVWRLCHTQSYTSRGYEGEKNYFAEAFAAINTRGTKAYWGSNWRRFEAEYSDAYQVFLPDNWTADVPAR